MILFGSTGTGKSTLANSLVNGPANIQFSNGKYHAILPVKHNQEIIFNIGHEVKTETKSPRFCILDNMNADIYLVDGPGINDNNLKHEYSN